MEDLGNRPKNNGGHHEDYVEGGEIQRAGYQLLLGRDGLAFETLTFNDPAPTARQILIQAGLGDTTQWAVVALLPSGDMEELGADEPLDLRARGVERVIGFRTDRLFRAILLDRALLWGRSMISGAELIALAGLSDDDALFLDVPGGTDRLISAESRVDLAQAQVERFVRASKPESGFEVVVIYNGLVQSVRLRPQVTVAEFIQSVRPLFGNPSGDLILVNENGNQLASERTLVEQGVRPNSRLQLRPPVVQGG